MMNKIKTHLENFSLMKLWEILSSDRMLRARLGLYGGLIINTLYAVFEFVTGFIYNSELNSAMAGYYIALSIIRFTLVKTTIKGFKGKTTYLTKLKRYRKTGIWMLWLCSTISGLINVILINENVPKYSVWVISLNIVYTTIMIILSIINIRKYHDLKHPVMCAAKAVCFSTALMSLFNLQVTLISRFEMIDSHIQLIANSMTGFTVTTMNLAMALFIIIRGTIVIKKHSNSVSKENN